MPRYLVKLEDGAAPSSIQPSLAGIQGVDELTPSRSFNGFVVTSSATAKQQVADQPGVQAVYDDIQAVPQVASEQDAADFLDRVREVRGEEAAPLVETEPTTAQPRADGGRTLLPTLTAGEQFPENAEPQFDTVPESASLAGADLLHSNGVTGDGVIIVVLDTGVAESQFAEERRLKGADTTDSDSPWSPYHGHGTMSAGIAAGGPETDGASPGFAPEADVFPIKSTLSASEIIQAQDIILSLAERVDRPVVVNNSWGFTQCDGLCDHPVTEAVQNANGEDGVYQVFAAGNQGEKCGQGCSDTGISGPNSLENGLTVGATGMDGDPGRLHDYSSRGGPTASCGSRKPDVAAPTFGLMPWGDGSRNMGNGGGTSAAAPQVSGATALLLSSVDGQPGSEAVFESVRSGAQQVNSGWDGCTGHGNLQASASVEAGPQAGALGSGFDGETAAVLGAGLLGAALASRFRGS